jgi:hypothetical protein
VNYAEEGMQIVQGTDAGFIKFGSEFDLFYLLNPINVVLNQKQLRKNDYCNKRIMNEKELDTRFQEAVDISLNDSGIFASRCPATSICLLQTGYFWHFRTKTNINLSFRDAFKECLDANQSSTLTKQKSST